MTEISYHSRLGSILFTTACVVTFALLASPVMRPHGGIQVSGAVIPTTSTVNLRVRAGKSLLVDSPSQIVGVSVGKPELAAAISVGQHELLINGKNPGDTNVTYWEADGRQKQLQLHVEREPDSSSAQKRHVAQQVAYHGVVASYENVMDRVENAIAGVAR